MRLADLCEVIRSKNAGPFLVTFDLFLPDDASFEALRDSGLLAAAAVAPLYGLQPQQVQVCALPSIRAFKLTLPRTQGTRGSGSPFDRDVYGAQQHGPLADLELDLPLPRPGGPS